MSDATTTQQQYREQFTAAGQATQEAFQAANEVALATAEWTLRTTEQGLRFNQDLRTQNDRIAQDAFATYRRWYEDGLRNWQGYVQSVTGIMNRSLDRR
ncbi:MAG: hypothetical protein M3R24_25880 [Chloroflexota bacterium]|nr:hypothetical protein [Chloroflexota bacterium]